MGRFDRREGVRVAKVALAGLIAVALWAMWSSRAAVTDAYRTDAGQSASDGPEMRLRGVDLAFQLSPIEPSPFTIPAAPDTSRTAPSVAFTAGLLQPLPAIEMSGGRARLQGSVVGPDGHPIGGPTIDHDHQDDDGDSPEPEVSGSVGPGPKPSGGAVVRVERHTSSGIGTLDVAVGPDGRWSVGGLPGGRYRVRAWVPGLLTMGRSDVRFVADDERATFDFSLWGVDPTPELTFLHGGPIYEGHSGTVAVVVSRRSVDAEGVIDTTPLAGMPVSIWVGREVTIGSDPNRITGQDGAARFELRCPAPFEPHDHDGVGQVTGVAGAVEDRPEPITPDPIVPAGSLIARSGPLAATFPLPGCQPVPEDKPEPSVQPTQPIDGAGDDG